MSEKKIAFLIAIILVTGLLFWTYGRGVFYTGNAYKVSGGRIVDNLGREIRLKGFNLFQWDLARRDGAVPVYQENFNQIASWGFNVVNLISHWSFIEPSEANPRVYDNAYLALLDEHVLYCKNAGLNAIIDVSLTDWSWAMEETLFLSSENQTRFYDMWRMLAARYADEPTVIGYYPLHVPWHARHYSIPEAENTWYNVITPNVISAIRDVSNKIIFWATLHCADAPYAWLTPLDDANVVYLFSNYRPPSVTHGSEDYNGDISSLSLKNPDSKFTHPVSFMEKYDVPMLVQEWGIKIEGKNMPGEPPTPSRLLWVEHSAQLHNEYGIHWLYWFYGYGDRDKGGFAVLNRDGTPRAVVDVLKKYAPT